MDRIDEQKISITRRFHKFFCDDCGKFLEEVQEYDDGYCPNQWIYSKSFYIYPYGNLAIEKDLCSECEEKLVKKIHDALINIGFAVEEAE